LIIEYELIIDMSATTWTWKTYKNAAGKSIWSFQLKWHR